MRQPEWHGLEPSALSCYILLLAVAFRLILTSAQAVSRAPVVYPSKDSSRRLPGGFSTGVNGWQHGGRGCQHRPAAEHAARAY